MEFHEPCSLEFMGGPYDGYVQTVSVPPENLLEMAALPINRNVLRVINGQPPGLDVATCNVAVYALHSRNGQLQYDFVGIRPIGGLQWDAWCAKICRAWTENEQTRVGQHRWD